MKDKVKMLLILAVIFSAWGSYKLGKSIYTSIVWEKAEGVVVDFPRHTFRCGKRRSKCYTLNVGFHVDDELVTVDSDKIYSEIPSQLLGRKITVYYPPADPWQASLAGDYGPRGNGSLFLLIGVVMFIIYFFARPRK